ncbi:hypothetical protein IUY40_18340 [Flavobacterium sp. ALJ2]|uniref:hypothetical protein n=1 Tax=Flavobacterium sp. ALJ2 TaxID=2786960 RepID=UPI00189C7296|nr:hypothetical protein [Flavobacterium sp. ALJ2]MBF7093495.1 hypothetical protein [Flavobacterium sp. ALJ2]
MTNHKKIADFYNIPDYISLSWSNGKKEFSSQFSFKEEETLSAFRKLKGQQKINPLMLELKINDANLLQG